MAKEMPFQRTLLLEGLDIDHKPLTGYPNIDKKLIEIRNQLRSIPGMNQKEIIDMLPVMFVLGNYTGQVIQDNIFRDTASESTFQKVLKQFLRSHPRIGSELEEHAHTGGGETDLSYKGIRIELKSEPNAILSFADCGKFVEQTLSYTVSSAKRLGVLCVLDCSKKTAPPFPAEDGIGVFLSQKSESPLCVITFLLQGNLAKPSSFSKR